MGISTRLAEEDFMAKSDKAEDSKEEKNHATGRGWHAWTKDV